MLDDRSITKVVNELKKDPLFFLGWLHLLDILVELRQYKLAHEALAKAQSLFERHFEKIKVLKNYNKVHEIEIRAEIETKIIENLNDQTLTERLHFLTPYISDTTLLVNSPFILPYLTEALIEAKSTEQLYTLIDIIIHLDTVKLKPLLRIAEYLKQCRLDYEKQIYLQITLEKILDLDFLNEFATITLGNLYIRNNEFHRCRHLLVVRLRSSDRKLSFLQLLSFNYLKSKNFNKCLTVAHRLAGCSADDNILRFNAACASLQLGMINHSSQIFAELLKFAADLDIQHRAWLQLMLICCQERELRRIHGDKLLFCFNNTISLRTNKKAVILIIIFHIQQSNFRTACELLDFYHNNDHFKNLHKLPDSKDEQFANAYFKFFVKLQPILSTYSSIHQDHKIIYMIGDSHIFSQPQTIYTETKKYQARVFPIFGLKYYHLSQNGNDLHKQLLERHIENIPEASHVLISLGEIDCRPAEGFLKNNILDSRNIFKVLNEAFSYIEKATQKSKIKIYLANVPAPTANSIKQDKRVVRLINVVNEHLTLLSSIYEYTLLDVYSRTKNKRGHSNDFYYLDGIHLHPVVYSKLFPSYLS
jgi:hypothetical protein